MRNKNSLYIESEALEYEDEYEGEYEGEWEEDEEEKFYHNRYFDLYNKLYFISVTTVILLSIIYYSLHWNQLGTVFTLHYFVHLSFCYGALLLWGSKRIQNPWKTMREFMPSGGSSFFIKFQGYAMHSLS